MYNNIELRITTVFLREDGIVQLNIKDDVTMDVQDVELIHKTINVLTQGVKHPILVITGERNTSTVAARKASMEYLRSESYALAEALVITSLPTRLSANFFFKFYQPKFPYKSFKTQALAEEWLKQFSV